MAKVIFNDTLCKGCGLCANACPKKILKQSDRVNDKGYKVYECEDAKKCIACGFCYTVCPDCVISISDEKQEAL